jgi:CBS domain-containing protein
MRTVDAIYRSGVAVEPHRTVRQAASIMEQAGIGSLAVVDGSRLVGILTDRDLVRRVLATGVAGDARIDSVMTTPVVTIEADAPMEVAYATFGTHGVRRLPVLRDGSFVGMLALDDLVVALVGHLAEITRPVAGEIMFAHRDAHVPATT